jgi:hypothetical protein
VSPIAIPSFIQKPLPKAPSGGMTKLVRAASGRSPVRTAEELLRKPVWS